MMKLNLKELRKNKNLKIVLSEEALKDIEPIEWAIYDDYVCSICGKSHELCNC